MADDDPARKADQHRRADLAGIGAAQLVMDILGAYAHALPCRRGGQRSANRCEAHERRADHPHDVGDIGPSGDGRR